jgi:hypothetical protein
LRKALVGPHGNVLLQNDISNEKHLQREHLDLDDAQCHRLSYNIIIIWNQTLVDLALKHL